MVPGTVLVGTSGWSCPEWKGPFYPDKLPARQMLSYYAQHFSAAEINSTYYHIPPARNMAAMAERAAGRLTFAVKAHQDNHARGQAVINAQMLTSLLALI